MSPSAFVAVRRDGWKLILALDGTDPVIAGPPRLFDLTVDPDEQRNLAEQHPERVEALRSEAKPWLDLGPLSPGRPANVEPEAWSRLRSLGYVID